MTQLARSDYATAQVTLERLLISDPVNITHWTLRGYVRQEAGDEKGAAEAFLKSLEVQSGRKVLVPVHSMFMDEKDLVSKMRLAGVHLEREDAQQLETYIAEAARGDIEPAESN